MGRFENEGAYEEAVDALSNVLRQCPHLKPSAAKKIEELTRELVSLEGSTYSKINANPPRDSEDCTKEDEALANLVISAGDAKARSDPMHKIRKGFQQFRTRIRKEQSLFRSLAESQHPRFMIFACCDSRVDPALILGLDVGEAFIVRNIASLVPAYSKNSGHASGGSAIEYAVLHLKVEHILIIGHSRCGGIKALLGMEEDGSNRFSEYIEDWISIAHRASKNVKSRCAPDCPFEDQWEACVKESVNTSLWNCMTYPFVKDLVEQEKLSLHGAYYDFVNGAFEHWCLNYKLVQSEAF